MAFENIVLPWRIKAPKGPPMSHMAKLRSEHSPSRPFHCSSSRKAALKGRLFPERERFCAGKAVYACFFTAWEHLHAFFPCIYQASWSDAAFGAASQSWKDICQSFLEFPESMVVLEAACPLWGGHLHVLNHW